MADSQIEHGRQAFRERYEAYQQAKEPAIVPEPQAQEVDKHLTVEKEPAKELEIKIEHGRGLGLGL